jgi:hypothetical protein
LFGRWIELTPAIRRFSFGRVQRTLCPHKVFSHLVCSCFLSFFGSLSCLNSLAKGSGQEKKSGASFSSVTA